MVHKLMQSASVVHASVPGRLMAASANVTMKETEKRIIGRFRRRWKSSRGKSEASLFMG